MLKNWLEMAKRGEDLWLDEARAACADASGTAPLVLRLTLLNGEVRDFPLALPRWRRPEERQMAAEYLSAHVFNLLSVLSGKMLTVCYDRHDPELASLMEDLPVRFQLSATRRDALGKVLNIADRLCRAFGGGAFAFVFQDLKDYRPAPPPGQTATELPERLRRAARRAEQGLYGGVDIGGTDIKLVLSRDGRLIHVGVLDWNPALSPTAEGILSPILEMLETALARHAPGRKLDGLGVSFPDVVIRDRIVGGETPKTQGLREHAADYEAEFAGITALRERLASLCAPGAPIRIINDGHMSAFTAAMELTACGGEERLGRGVVALAMGTDLGVGWLDPDGSIPDAPMEFYDLLLNLGNTPARAFPATDLRSVLNENSGLPDARRYVGQAAAFRLAWEQDPALLEAFVRREGERVSLIAEPDLRKPCLEHLMAKAAGGDSRAEEVFRAIGRHLGHVCREMDWLLQPKTNTRFLFGRFVKDPVCFALLREGCASVAPHIELNAADEDLAATPLMKALAARPDAPVAQFAQAVGAIYYCLL